MGYQILDVVQQDLSHLSHKYESPESPMGAHIVLLFCPEEDGARQMLRPIQM
jgi:hypothetical protein